MLLVHTGQHQILVNYDIYRFGMMLRAEPLISHTVKHETFDYMIWKCYDSVGLQFRDIREAAAVFRGCSL